MELKFQASRRTLWLLLLACACFAGLGVLLRHAKPWESGMSMVLFGGGAVVMARCLYLGKPTLCLHRQGLRMEGMWGAQEVRWDEVVAIEERYIRGHLMLLVRYRLTAHRPGTRGQPKVQQIVLSNIYDAPLEGILKTLKAWHKLYAT